MTCLLAALMLAKGPPTWYGPATVTATIPYTGNPYDPTENDVDVVFAGPRGTKLTRLAYFVGDGKFASTLVAPVAGEYTATVIRNGHVVATLPTPVTVSEKLPHGFIRSNGNHFAWTDGTPYFPIGYDYGWRNGNGETVAQGMTKMGKSGAASFVRLFMVPGMEHCGGGPGPNYFGQDGDERGGSESSIYAAIEQWVEKNVAPSHIIATKYANSAKSQGDVKMTRPLCAFPQVAKYKGSGDSNDAANFTCGLESQ